jgi:ankyrin repeat protein
MVAILALLAVVLQAATLSGSEPKRLYDIVSTDQQLSKAKLDEMRALLRMGIAPDGFTHPSYGDTALIQAAYEGHGGAVDALLLYGADPNAADNEGETALMLASQRGYEKVAAALLASGADVTMADKKSGETALGRAKYAGHLTIHKRLLASTAQSEKEAKASARLRTQGAKGGKSKENCADGDGDGTAPPVELPAGFEL